MARSLCSSNGLTVSRRCASAGFGVVSINAPFMVGSVEGLPSQIFEPYVQWAEGKIGRAHV